VRDLVLAALLDGPAHGYELMSRLEEMAAGRWRPSPGSVYPLLQLLEDQGLAVGTDMGGRKIYELTAEGRAAADRVRLDELASSDSAPSQHLDLRVAVDQLRLAARQVVLVGSTSQVERALGIVNEARQALYRLLADQ
jgi:DNA-binding PadR family transcriptional regulator